MQYYNVIEGYKRVYLASIHPTTWQYLNIYVCMHGHVMVRWNLDSVPAKGNTLSWPNSSITTWRSNQCKAKALWWTKCKYNFDKVRVECQQFGEWYLYKFWVIYWLGLAHACRAIRVVIKVNSKFYLYYKTKI